MYVCMLKPKVNVNNFFISIVVQRCKTRWKTLKARYDSEYSKTKSDSAYKSNWVYMEEMSFMESYLMQQEYVFAASNPKYFQDSTNIYFLSIAVISLNIFQKCRKGIYIAGLV